MRCLGCWALVFATSGALAAQCPDDAWIESARDDAMAPAVVVVEAAAGRPAKLRGFGATDAGDAVNGRTVFHAASLGKVVAAFAVLDMVDAQVLALDAPLAELIPRDWAQPEALGREITARHVLTHTSGLSNAVGPPSERVAFEPGSAFSYSGSGFGYLQHALEAQTQAGIEDLMRARVFEPLGMSDSTFEPGPQPELVTPHIPVWWPLVGLALTLALGMVPIALFLRKRPERRVRRLVIAFVVVNVISVLLFSMLLRFEFLWVVVRSIVTLDVLIGLIVCLVIAVRRADRRLGVAVAVGGAVWFWWVSNTVMAMPVFGADDAPAEVAYTLTTTGADMGRFATAWLDRARAGSGALADGLAPAVELANGSAWALGIGMDRAEPVTHWQWGDNPGYESLMAFDVASGRGVVVMTNVGGGVELAKAIARQCLGTTARWSIF